MELLIDEHPVKHAYGYQQYHDLVQALAEEGGTTGTTQSQERIDATKINAQRMKRLEKRATLLPELEALLRTETLPWRWIVLMESWCGDGAQNLPILNRIAEYHPSIELQVILRDEHPHIMNDHLTDGKEAIPKLICIDKHTEKKLGTWGPRPKELIDEIQKWKAEEPEMSKDELIKGIQKWYGKDRGQALQRDLLRMIPEWKGS